jgi:hypothetical protein
MRAQRRTQIRLTAGAVALALGVTGAGVAMAAQGTPSQTKDTTRVHVGSRPTTAPGFDDRMRPVHERAERRHGTDDLPGHDREHERREHVRPEQERLDADHLTVHTRHGDDRAGDDRGRSSDDVGDDHGSDG